MKGRVLTVAESDSCGGAGIQADLKTIMAFGGYASTAITALTAQNTHGVISFQMSDPEFVAQQMRVVLGDVGADVIKTGILGNIAIIDAVADVLDEVMNDGYAVIVDPAIVARSGDALMDAEAIATLKRRLLVRATVITPNRAEAELLTGMKIRDLDDMRHAADMMRTLGAEAVVLKGGQMSDGMVIDLIATEEGEEVFESPLIDSRHTHGAGCTLASGIAACLAQGQGVVEATERALEFLNEAIQTAPGFGSGTGPLNHSWAFEQELFQAAE